jgi:hypothetical protein
MIPRWTPLLLLLAGSLPAAAAKFPDDLAITRTRNVFDSTRQVSSSRSNHSYTPTATVRQDTLRLCGVWEADGAIVAISESSSGTTAPLQPGGMVGTWKIESISLKEVLLVEGTVRLHWRPGASLVRTEGGKWTLSQTEITPADSPVAAGPASPSTPSATEPGKPAEPSTTSGSTGSSTEDILKRLKERREKETKK